VFTRDWTTSHVREWNHLPEVEHALEVGCFEGKSTLWFLENKAKHIDVVDTFGEFAGNADLQNTFEENTKAYQDRITIHKGYSHAILPKLERKYGLIYIDGGHSAWNAMGDILFSWYLLLPNGVMVIDDYEWLPEKDYFSRPKPAIEFLLEAKKPKILHKGYQVIVQKV
jgi:predicted O-methyltransferase YrrM